MPPLRTVALFFARLIAIYALLAAPWPGLARAYASAYHAVGNAWFGGFGGDGIVRFAPAPAGDGASDTVLTIGNRVTGAEGTSPHSARITGYLPTIETIALILATPLPWARRGRALIWGLVICHVLIWLRLQVVVLHFFTGPEPWALYQPWGWVDWLLAKATRIGVVSPTPSFILPVLVWLGVTFRRGDLEEILAQEPSPPAD